MYYKCHKCITVTVLYFLNKTVKNFSSITQNIYTQLSGNFSPIFSGFISRICAKLVQFVRNLDKLHAILAHFQRNFRANSAQILHFFPAIFFRHWLLPHASKILLLLPPATFLFLCASSISGTTGRICAKSTVKTCLVPRSDQFERQGQRLKVKVTRDKKRVFTPITPAATERNALAANDIM